MSVAHILSVKGNQVVTTTPEKSLHEAAQKMAQNGIGAIIVSGPAGEIAGILSERDIMRAIAELGANALEERIANHMTCKVVTASMDSTPVSIMQRMTAGRFRHMPVLREGELEGIVSIGDLIKYRLTELEDEQQALKEYIASA